MWVLNIKRKYFSMMPAPYEAVSIQFKVDRPQTTVVAKNLSVLQLFISRMPKMCANQRWRVIWFVHILQNSGAEVSFFLGICERTVERYISRFLMNGHVKPTPVSRSYDGISFAPREELIAFAHQIWKQLPLAVLSNSGF